MSTLEQEGRVYVGAACTLNGRPAKVIGARLPFATVATLDGELLYDWTWRAVAIIMRAGGTFKS